MCDCESLALACVVCVRGVRLCVCTIEVEAHLAFSGSSRRLLPHLRLGLLGLALGEQFRVCTRLPAGPSASTPVGPYAQQQGASRRGGGWGGLFINLQGITSELLVKSGHVLMSRSISGCACMYLGLRPSLNSELGCVCYLRLLYITTSLPISRALLKESWRSLVLVAHTQTHSRVCGRPQIKPIGAALPRTAQKPKTTSHPVGRGAHTTHARQRGLGSLEGP